IIFSPPIYLYKIIITNIGKLTILIGLIFVIINYIKVLYFSVPHSTEGMSCTSKSTKKDTLKSASP
ncbi:hypothetical protein, partial [Bacillus cereus]|uniref:hypothetical protein n=1 Tax=Bacillus cereus TaxID=1396 RepID=UPI0019605AC3